MSATLYLYQIFTLLEAFFLFFDGDKLVTMYSLHTPTEHHCSSFFTNIHKYIHLGCLKKAKYERSTARINPSHCSRLISKLQILHIYIYIYICPFFFLFHFKRKWFCLNWGHFLIFGLLKTIINLLLHQNRNPKILISPERKAGKGGRENWLTKPLFLTLSVFTALFQSYIINCLEDIALSNIIGNGFAPLICLEKGTITCK